MSKRRSIGIQEQGGVIACRQVVAGFGFVHDAVAVVHERIPQAGQVWVRQFGAGRIGYDWMLSLPVCLTSKHEACQIEKMRIYIKLARKCHFD